MAIGKLEPLLFVIFGGTGDLTKRKLLPALTELGSRGRLAGDSAVLAIAHDEMDDDAYREWAQAPLMDAGLDPQVAMPWCDRCLHYRPIRQGVQAIAARITELERVHDLPGNRVFYLALPPAAFGPTLEALGRHGLNRSPGWTRVVIEKPFGTDLESARALNRLVHRHFAEEQVYRIDHYLGKETVQNLLVFRFANPIFESLWNRDRIESVHITVAEAAGVGHRAAYYDRSGALRDMVQNHLTQLLTLVAMEVPAAFDADAIRAEKVKVLRTAERIGPDDAVFGQYVAGEVDGAPMPGYRDEPGVPEDSTTETFVALRLGIANWRWQGVPFFLRTGKRLPARLTQIAVVFRRPPVSIFQPYDECRVHSNVLVLRLQPREGFELGFEVKRPREGIALATQHLHFEYADAFGPLHEAYETLLLDVMRGDQTLFVHADEVEASWRLFTPLLNWRGALFPYPAGTWGPEAAERLGADPTLRNRTRLPSSHTR